MHSLAFPRSDLSPHAAGRSLSALSDVSEIFVATDGVEIVGVGSLFRGFSIPSVVITDSDLAIQSALLARIHKHVDAEWLTLSTSASFPIFCQFGKRIHAHTEQQMLLRTHVPQHRAKPARLIEKSELNLLDQLYKEHRLEAWTPLMFDMGPYYGVWCNGRLVAAAGIHFVTPFIAQIGNLFTHPNLEGKGLLQLRQQLSRIICSRWGFQLSTFL